jgi:hypothetical protein
MTVPNSLPFPPSAEDGDIVIRDELIGVYHEDINTWEVKRLGGPPSLTVASVDPWVDKAYGTNSIVVWNGRLYASLTPIVVGDPAPDDPANIKWRDVTNPGAKGDKGDQGAPPPIYFVTATQVANVAATIPGNTLQQNLDAAYAAANPTTPAKESEFFVVTTVGTKADSYAGIYIRRGLNWVPAGGGGGSSGGVLTDQFYRASASVAQATPKNTGDLDILTETNNHQINVFDGTTYQSVFNEQTVKAWIASGSLFQGTLSSDAGLAALPTPSNANKGFYWTWTGSPSHSTSVPISVTLQVGDWLQSDGLTYVHVPSDLMSKLRWESVGSFKTWADGSFEQASLVTHNGALYRANSAIVPGDVAPDDPAAKWTKLSFTTIDELTNVEVTTGTLADGQLLRYSLLDAKWKNAKVSLGDLDDVDLTTTPPTNGQLLSWNTANSRWVPFTVTSSVATLTDVNLGTAPTDGQYLKYNAAGTNWIPATPVTNLDGLTDVTLATPSDGQLLKFNGTSGQWENITPNYLNPTNGYNKVEIDNKINSLVTGLEHYESVLSRTDTPPATPAANDLYIVGTTPTGLWAGQANKLARWDGTAWQFADPRTNETHLVEDVAETWHWNGTAWVKVAAATTATAVSTTPVGTIIQSVLTPQQFQTAMGADGSKWRLAAGGDCTGTAYATLTGATTLPDLRGSFLRMAGQSLSGWDGGALNGFTEDSTARPKNAFTGSTNSAGVHTHGLWSRRMNAYSGAGYSPAAQTVGEGINAGGVTNVSGRWMDSDGSHSHTVQITGGGDAETKPKSYAVNYFIKVN